VIASVLGAGLIAVSGLAFGASTRSGPRGPSPCHNDCLNGAHEARVGSARRFAHLVVDATSLTHVSDSSLAGVAVVKNSGARRARSSSAAVYWRDGKHGDLILLGRFTEPALRPGRRHKRHFIVPVPANAAAGTYTVSVCANVRHQVREGTRKKRCTVSGKVVIAAHEGSSASSPAAITIDLCGPISHDETLSPQDAGAYLLTCEVSVDRGVTLTLAAGTVVKAQGVTGMRVEGAVDANGTAADPVTFTSVDDNSVGGVTGDGSATATDWIGITVVDGGSADLLGTTVEHATTALTVGEEADVTLHGAILDSSLGVSSNAFADVTEVNWGNPSGPAPAGSGTHVEGEGVWATPWVGYTEPPQPPPASWQPEKSACADFAIIGVRGSGEAPQGDPLVFANNESGFGERDRNALTGFEAAMESAGGYSSGDFVALGLHYPALGVSLPFFLTEEDLQSIDAGQEELVSELREIISRCPNERAVLVGYSQGALVIHLALRTLAMSDPAMLSSGAIAGVMLIADPGRIPHGSETLWEAAEVQAASGSQVAGASGMWTAADGRGEGPLPAAITGRTISFCADHDPVCALGFGAHPSIHVGYYNESNLGAMGRWMARRVLGLG
jgi:hypothetical protein